jgi:hypothetical protein
METVIRIGEVGSVAAAVGVAYWFLVRPWRREGRVTLDGLFVIAFASLYWQDPLANYSQAWVTYNTAFVNFGSWTTDIPGWLAPNGNLFPEAVLWAGPVYIYAIFTAVLVANQLMRRAKQRWPRLGTAGLVGLCFAFFVVADLFIEVAWMRLGWFAYPGSISWLTIFHGHYYQFPIYEPILFGACWTAFACLRYFRDDKGRTLAERGIDELRATPRQKSGLRLLALVGALNAILLVGYEVPIQWFALHADEWPQDIVKRSYLTDGLCGPGTDYACSGPGVPVPRPDSAHLGPDGRLRDGRK